MLAKIENDTPLKFKVGDKVRVNNSAYSCACRGKVGTVAEYTGNPSVPYRLNFSDNTHYCVGDPDIDKVENNRLPKFKVGDKVRHNDETYEAIGTILDKGELDKWLVQWGDSGESYLVCEKYMYKMGVEKIKKDLDEKALKSIKAEVKLKIGDKVKVVDNQYFNGRPGVIKSRERSGQYFVKFTDKKCDIGYSFYSEELAKRK
jgi:hypothetical protein